MADIGSISGFNPATTRSNLETDAVAQRRAEEAQRQAALEEEQRVNQAAEEAAQTEEDDSQAQSQADDRQLTEDTVTLSSAAQDFLVQSDRNATDAANDDSTSAADATERAAAASVPTQISGLNGTNQTTSDDETTAAVNGNQDNQSEQTRALGQLVDQFA